MNIVITTLFGIEAVTADELLELGFDRDQFELSDGQVVLEAGDAVADVALAVARTNVFLRTAERVLLQLAEFPATEFEMLFDRTLKLPWEKWIPAGYAFHINGYSRKSRLFGISACQSLIKKAIVRRLLVSRGQSEDGMLAEDPSLGLIRVQFSIISDQVRMMVDTSGDGLHKRGYRPLQHEAPIKETLAAAILRLARFRPFGEEALLDPMCGSGTFPIEAALIARHQAPGMHRPFAAERWPFIGKRAFDLAREEAFGKIDPRVPEKIFIFGSDLAPQAVAVAQANAQRAGVADLIDFRQMDVLTVKASRLPEQTGYDRHLIVCNPPYGDRLLDEDQAIALHEGLIRTFLDRGQVRPDIRFNVITPLESFEQMAGAKADKRRKLYNGMIKCTLYQYFRQSHHQKERS